MTMMKRSLMLCTSAMVLASCLPEAPSSSLTEKRKEVTQLSQQYASTYMTDTNKALKNLLNSKEWSEESLADGVINFSSLTYSGTGAASLSKMTKAAKCQVDGKNNLVTWIKEKDSDGYVNLSGLNNAESSIVASTVRGLATTFQTGISTRKEKRNENNELVLAKVVVDQKSNEEILLSGNCASLNIPLNSPVLFAELKDPHMPVEALATQVTRVVVCGNNADGMAQDGTKTQSIDVVYKDDGTIEADNRIFHSMEELMSHDSGWRIVMEQCQEVVSPPNIDENNQVANIYRGTGRSLKAEYEAIQERLQNNLSEVNCVQSDLSKDGETAQSFNTCEEATVNDDPGSFQDEVSDEEVDVKAIQYSCESDLFFGSQDDEDEDGVIVDLDAWKFKGLPEELAGANVTIKAGGFGENDKITIDEVTRTKTVKEGNGSAIIDDDVVDKKYVNPAVHCSRKDTIVVGCNDFFPAIASKEGIELIEDSKGKYVRKKESPGWELEPGESVGSVAELKPERLKYVDEWISENNGNYNCKWEKVFIVADSTGNCGASEITETWTIDKTTNYKLSYDRVRLEMPFYYQEPGACKGAD